ncbi:YfiH family protein [Desulfohalotomaculum tongense]|uniref:peptidoglycan editing factor PgeF n=1 Tax=Desulforadius tongensis TaxID=1216062 RepID=UPI00195927CF|nr:peptidoglycan editing factor PgeF [Desulforadius tongensis]MBM7855234.1 YfiH family protein [Desulforadius tongensis]
MLLTNGFAINKYDHLWFYSIPAFTATGLVVHGFTTRMGGVSTGSYASLNLGLHVGDDAAAVLENRRRVCRALGLSFHRLVAAQQVHGGEVCVVASKHQGMGSDSVDQAIANVDALITNVPGIPLSSYYADCVPLFFLDPVNKAVGLAHAGWKGTVQKIGVNTLQRMSSEFGTDPGDLLVGIGPSIGPCCYVVDSRVINKLTAAFSCWNELVKPCGREKWLLDLWETNKRALLEAGVKEKNITVAKMCTSCHSDMFFSHRASGGCTGRMASLIMLKDERNN